MLQIFFDTKIYSFTDESSHKKAKSGKLEISGFHSKSSVLLFGGAAIQLQKKDTKIESNKLITIRSCRRRGRSTLLPSNWLHSFLHTYIVEMDTFLFKFVVFISRQSKLTILMSGMKFLKFISMILYIPTFSIFTKKTLEFFFRKNDLKL